MDYILAVACGFLLGMITMSLFAASGAQDREREFSEYFGGVVEDLTKIIGTQMIEIGELDTVNRNLCARLDKRTVTLMDETGMAVEMPVEEVA